MTVYDEFARTIALGAASAEGVRMLEKTDMTQKQFVGHQDFQFDVADGSPFYVRFEDAQFSLHMGETPRTSSHERIFGRLDTETMWDIIEGRLKPSDAIFDDRWKDVTGNSHPKRPFLNLLAAMLRMGQEERLRSIRPPRPEA